MLTGPEIKRQVELGHIVIDPFDEKNLGANSYDLRLGDQLLVYRKFFDLHLNKGWSPWLVRRPALDMAQEEEAVELVIPAEGLVLWPNVLYLGSTLEYTETHAHAPIIEGRSSVARLGLQVHITAGFGDCDFRGTWCLEMSVIHPLRVYAGVRVCQIAYLPVEGALQAYTGKYQGQRGPVASQLWRDFQKP